MQDRREPPFTKNSIEVACIWCRWWTGVREVDDCVLGECRRLAPTNINNCIGTGFALTAEHEFCAQFKPVAGVAPNRFIFPIINNRTPDL